MSKELWSGIDIQKLFQNSFKSVVTLYNAEERGEIPKANRVSRGKVEVRQWNISQIPDIGRKFGALKPPKKQKILCIYIQKGGVLKTTTTFNIAQLLALNGIKTLIVGQDFECSITDIILPRKEITTLSETDKILGLYHFLVEDAPVTSVIQKTYLPTLDIIPETHDLVILDKWLGHTRDKVELVYKEKLIPVLDQYEVIVFDNSPSWNHLIENAIVCSDIVVCTLGCNLLAYNASETNLHTILDFQRVMGLLEQQVIMIATLLERSSISQQIYAQYVLKLSPYLIPIPVRHSAKMQEALIHKQTVIENVPNSPLAQDYHDLIINLWKRVNN